MVRGRNREGMLSQQLITRLFEDADIMAPQEMCGLLFSESVTPLAQGLALNHTLKYGQYLRCQNVDSNPERGFLLHHDEYQEAVRSMGKAPWALVHSHPLASAGASPKDCGLMDAFEVAKIEMDMVIVGLNPREIRIFSKQDHVYKCIYHTTGNDRAPKKVVTVLITNTATKETRVYVDHYIPDPEDWPPFMWNTGNYRCDCNRALFFARAAHEPEPVDPPCGHERFTVTIQHGPDTYSEK